MRTNACMVNYRCPSATLRVACSMTGHCSYVGASRSRSTEIMKKGYASINDIVDSPNYNSGDGNDQPDRKILVLMHAFGTIGLGIINYMQRCVCVYYVLYHASTRVRKCVRLFDCAQSGFIWYCYHV